MLARTLVVGDVGRGGAVRDASVDPGTDATTDATTDAWIDIQAGPDDVVDVFEITDELGLDRLAVRDAVVDVDLPKVDDFDDHLLVVFHGLRDDEVGTYEIHCFLTAHRLVTICDRGSPAIEAVWARVTQEVGRAPMTVDLVLVTLADALSRRLIGVLDAFDDRIEELTARALNADGAVLEDLIAVRADIVDVRRIVHPQREALDVLRSSSSPLVSDVGRRKFSDVFDVASRAASGLDEARSALSETLDAYRGAEARAATEVTKVLTVYAAIMLPLSLIAGFFGMNFVDLPWASRSWGWVAATGVMVGVAVVSMGMFISLGWVRRPSGRRAGRAIGRGLVEATKTPVHIVGAVLEVTALPLRATSNLINGQPAAGAADPDDDPDDARHHGSE